MATKKTAGGEKSAPLDPRVADKLLDLLGTNNEFRRLFKKDPQAALAQLGYREPKEDGAERKRTPPHGCCKVDRIAPKADIIKARESLRAYLTSGLDMTPIQLNVATTASRRTRK